MRLLFVCLFCFSFATSLSGQAKPKTITLTKGQAFDIILFNNNPAAKAERKDYFQRAFPIARSFGYKPSASFGVAETPTRGNYHPDFLVTGTWPSVSARALALEALQSGMADFDEMRRKVWSSFNMTYYEVKEDLTITTDTTKYYVATTFWKEKPGRFAKFLRKWEARQQQFGGKVLITLSDGASPFGYYYNPDYLVITEWASEEAFCATLPADDQAGFRGVKHLNQFPIF